MARYEKDEEAIERIIVDEATRTDQLKPMCLRIILDQYIYADPYQRELDKEQWVKRVIKRKSMDYFPNPQRLLITLYEVK